MRELKEIKAKANLQTYRKRFACLVRSNWPMESSVYSSSQHKSVWPSRSRASASVVKILKILLFFLLFTGLGLVPKYNEAKYSTKEQIRWKFERTTCRCAFTRLIEQPPLGFMQPYTCTESKYRGATPSKVRKLKVPLFRHHTMFL